MDSPDDKTNSNLPLDTEFQYIPTNPYTIQGTLEGGGSSEAFPGNAESDDKSFWKGFKSEAYEFNTPSQVLHSAYERFEKPNPLEDITPPDWNANNPDMLTGVRNQYLPYMLEATGPKDQQYRLQRIMSEQDHDDNLANGSITGRIFGGIGGVITDPLSYIPIVGWAKYAKFAPTILKSAARAFPGIAGMSVLQNAAKEMDKVNGNLTDFLTNSMIDTVFGTALFGGIGAASLITEKMNLWNMRGLIKHYMDGVDYKLATDEEGKVTGIKAINPDGNLSAAQVDIAQKLADSSYHQGGLFKVPYVGTAAYKVLSNIPFLSAPLLKMLDSPFPSVRGAVDRMADHGISTKGVVEGKIAPQKFSNLMNQEYAELRSIQAQLDGLYLERLGYSTSIRPLNGLINLGLSIKNATIDKLSSVQNEKQIITKQDFHSEIDRVLYTEESSEHAATNEGAAILKKKRDQIWKDYRKSENLPEDWLPPRMAKGYSSRVYNTEYMNNHENDWINVLNESYAKSDAFIQEKMRPLTDLEEQIKLAKGKEKKALQIRKSALEERLQNEMRSNPDFHPYIENWHDLSADEAKELGSLLKPIEDIKQQIAESKKVKKKKGEAKVTSNTQELEDQLFLAEDELQAKIQRGEINPRFYRKVEGSQKYVFRDLNERLKFRDVIGSEAERRSLAKYQYNAIMNQTAEDTMNQVLGRYLTKSGIGSNPTLERSVMVPDEVLYDNNFMSKDLMAKFSNYVTLLARRTHLKTAFGDLSEEGNIQPLLSKLHQEHEDLRATLNNKLAQLNPEIDKKEIKSIRKELNNKRKQFETAKQQLNHLFSKMMGISSYSYASRKWQRGIMAFTAIANLPFVPFTMINDLSNIVLKAGLTPFIRDSVSPLLTSLGGLLKTKDSEAFRKAAPSIHLALQDITTGYADRNWSMQTNPYVNMGKVVNSLEWLAHSSTNFTLTNYLDNYLQRMAASAHQSEFMRILHAYKDGTMSKKEGIYVRKYGIDPKQWSDRMIKAFEEQGGTKGKLGGYQSLFWRWQDQGAANQFGDALFRAVKDTIIQRDLADAPAWADNPIGALIFGFQGWTFASLNRFVIPSMQEPDARKLTGILVSLLTGAMVDPLRRLARGEDALPPNQTDEQFMFAAIQNSGYFSYFNNVLSDANVLTGDKLLGGLRSDRYRDRTRIGLVGPAFGTMNRMFDIVSALASGEFNKADAKKMARMIPYANGTWTYWAAKKLIDGLNIPETRTQAHALKSIDQ